jgi:hypothetical protein
LLHHETIVPVSWQVFGARLQLRAPSLAALAAELLQPAAPGGGAPKRPLCPSPDESLVAAVHCKLLDVVSRLDCLVFHWLWASVCLFDEEWKRQPCHVCATEAGPLPLLAP